MLQFFRKYQKFFFIIVSVVIVISFSFFGTFGTFTERSEVPDREIGKLIDGSLLTEHQLFGMIRLLEHGIEEGGRSANLLNDSIIHKELVLSGLGEMLAVHFYEELQPELAEKWKRIKNYVPYSHPYAPQISARKVWQQMAPQINSLLEEVKHAPEEFSKDQIPLLFKLYAAQADFPPPLLLQMLYFQQSQGNQIRPDPGLPSANVALFGFESIEEWFGSKFVEEVGKFIFNAALMARQEGYAINREEAQVDLLRNTYQALKFFNQGENPSQEQTYNIFQNQIRLLGLSEKQAIDNWCEVLLFRRFFQEVGESIFLDRIAMQQFKDFATPSLSICRYALPKALQFKTLWDMLKFQRYLEIAYEGNYLDLPEKQRDPQEIREEHPELIYKFFEVEVSQVKKEDVASLISLKQTWDWEADEENFSQLQKEFPSLSEKKKATVTERMEALDELNELIRLKVDTFARRALVDAHPEWIDEALYRAPKERKTLKVRLKGGDPLFSGENFLARLEKESKDLEKFTADGENFYSVQVIEKGRGWNLLSFEEAYQDGTLEESLHNLLLAAYEAMENQKSYDECKEEIGAKMYTDILEKIGPYEDYATVAQHRFDDYLEQMRALAVSNFEEFEEKQKNSLWPLEKKEEQLILEDIALKEGEFSILSDGSFFQLLEKKKIEPSEEEIAQVKQHLARDAQQKLMESVLQRI